jgi:hypothetical protein
MSAHWDDDKVCWYCGAIVTERYGVGDHAPIPARNGGKDVVDCCVRCHDMKDRIPLDRWPAGFIAKVFSQLNDQPREIKIFIAKTTALLSDYFVREGLPLDKTDYNESGEQT